MKRNMHRVVWHLFSGLFLLIPGIADADGSNIGKLYHPYAQAGEHELEGLLVIPVNPDRLQGQGNNYRLGYGQAVGEYGFAELNLIGATRADGDFDAAEVEMEALWQLTEQGEYAADWGLLFEYERSFKTNGNVSAVSLLVEKQWQRWSGTANLKLIYEDGQNTNNEFETALAGQIRYRYSSALEPAVELYVSQGGTGIGPVLMGDLRVVAGKKLHWEVGVIAGLDKGTATANLKMVLEFEF